MTIRMPINEQTCSPVGFYTRAGVYLFTRWFLHPWGGTVFPWGGFRRPSPLPTCTSLSLSLYMYDLHGSAAICFEFESVAWVVACCCAISILVYIYMYIYFLKNKNKNHHRQKNDNKHIHIEVYALLSIYFVTVMTYQTSKNIQNMTTWIRYSFYMIAVKTLLSLGKPHAACLVRSTVISGVLYCL
jgi:hypothetical protein